MLDGTEKLDGSLIVRILGATKPPTNENLTSRFVVEREVDGIAWGGRLGVG
ncbi:MAG: hypothetical protein BWY95_02237 [Bacteroidetes bacterium ADurb.BinA104]|nr:MAG: hypothetical protein BWY95_02237 [Bacteroidetes bacterium ADurb.BinA104]